MPSFVFQSFAKFETRSVPKFSNVSKISFLFLWKNVPTEFLSKMQLQVKNARPLKKLLGVKFLVFKEDCQENFLWIQIIK